VSESLCLSKCVELREGDMVRDVHVGSGRWRVESLWYEDVVESNKSGEEDGVEKEIGDGTGWIVC